MSGPPGGVDRARVSYNVLSDNAIHFLSQYYLRVRSASAQRDAHVATGRTVYAQRIGDSAESTTGLLRGVLPMILMLYGNDIAGRPLTEFVGSHPHASRRENPAEPRRGWGTALPLNRLRFMAKFAIIAVTRGCTAGRP